MKQPSVTDWWERALALEQLDQLKEAESMILDNLHDRGASIQTAEMYRLRMLRLRQAGDNAGADAARERAVHWAWDYASQATSGGEGLALSCQRDQFIKSLYHGE